MVDFRLFFSRFGGPEVIEREDVDAATLMTASGEVRIRHQAVGLNLIDTYQRSGPLPGRPAKRPGQRGRRGGGSGRRWGRGLCGRRSGRLWHRTARCLRDGPRHAGGSIWSSCPATIAEETAAAAMLKGMTACYLIEQCAKVQPGQAVLVHAAAGGMGSILVPWLKRVGALVIGHAGTADKAAQAQAAGADHALSCPMDELAA